MATMYQATNSQYNKDATFAKLSIDKGFEATLLEAVAVDVDDNKFTVFAYVESAAGVEKYGDKEWTFTAQLCRFDVVKKDHKGYGDKDVVQHPLHAAIAYAVMEDIGFGKPFSAEIQGANTKLHEVIKTGEHKGEKVDKDTILQLIQKQSFEYELIDELDKMKGLSLEAAKGFTKGGGANAKMQLAQRLEFVEECTKPDSKFRSLAAELGLTEDEITATLQGYLTNVVN